MQAPLPKPVRATKEPKPLQRKTYLRVSRVDTDGNPILTIAYPKSMKRSRFRFKGFDEEWARVRSEWFELNPPDYRGYYQCALCPFEVPADETTLDHIEPRSTNPYLKYVLDNLQPAHALCNVRKGSISQEWYMQAYCPNGKWVKECSGYGSLSA